MIFRLMVSNVEPFRFYFLAIFYQQRTMNCEHLAVKLGNILPRKTRANEFTEILLHYWRSKRHTTNIPPKLSKKTRSFSKNFRKTVSFFKKNTSFFQNFLTFSHLFQRADFSVFFRKFIIYLLPDRG